jgi:hypothetical protein
MSRPLCPVCKQRFCAVNYYREDRVYYRGRCESCIKKNQRAKTPVARWQTAGYKKKPTCDLCGFKSKYAAQLLVYHVDGDMNNVAVRNLKTVCQNCVIEVARANLLWRAGDLEPDR